MDLDTIKRILLDVSRNDVNNEWSEGYLSALVDHNIITEDDFDILITWIKSTPE